MKATIKDLLIHDIRSYDMWPEDLMNFCVVADIIIGPNGGDGGDLFILKICSPNWLKDTILRPPVFDPSHEQTTKVEFGRHYLFMEELDETKIVSAIESIVERAQGLDWTEIATFLSRFFAWEFEDYTD